MWRLFLIVYIWGIVTPYLIKLLLWPRIKREIIKFVDQWKQDESKQKKLEKRKKALDKHNPHTCKKERARQHETKTEKKRSNG